MWDKSWRYEKKEKRNDIMKTEEREREKMHQEKMEYGKQLKEMKRVDEGNKKSR